MKIRLILYMAIFLLAWTQAQGEIIIGRILNWKESGPLKTIGDGTNHVTLWWSVKGACDGWFYGSEHTNDSDVAFATGITNIKKILDASIFSFENHYVGPGSDADCDPDGVGDFIVWRNINTGHYGVLRIDDIYIPPGGQSTDAELDGTWWFQTDGTGNFSYWLYVGVHYYPWYYNDFHGGQYLREHLVPTQLPELGEYNDRDETVINQHLEWSRYAGVDFWSASWWGPGSREDVTLLNHIFQNPNLGSLKIAIHYETTGRTNDFQDYSNLGPDITYLANNYFAHPNYLKINGKPVVIVYLTRVLSSRGTLQSSLATMRQAATGAGYQLYIVGDQVFGSPPASAGDISLLDAIINYDVYGSMGATVYAGQAMVDAYFADQAGWKALADSVGTDYAPAVTPGFNDRGVRPGHVPLSRKLTQSDEFGSLFRAMLRRTKKLTDPDIGHMILVTSWNEWHEDTQIEPLKEAPPTSIDDSPTGTDYTGGLAYEGYGTRYLDILAVETLLPVPNISVSPISLNFGDVTEGASSSAETVTISNTGNEDLIISNIQITPTDAADFGLNVSGGSYPCGDTACTILAGDNCTVEVTFSPQTTGDKSASLEITSNDPDEGTVTVTLSGTGSAVVTGDGDGDGDGKKGCFIATAAYDPALHPYVETLRDFRDIYLMRSKLGRALVNLYYKYSPYVAELITKHKAVKVMVRINLLPFVAFSYSMVHLGPIITTLIIAFICMFPILFTPFFRKRLRQVR